MAMRGKGGAEPTKQRAPKPLAVTESAILIGYAPQIWRDIRAPGGQPPGLMIAHH